MGEAPLADRLRPKNLDEFVGQAHLVGQAGPIKTAIEKKHKFSFVLWGPPGVGKTTLARIYADSLGAEFVNLSAVSAGKDDVRKVVERAKKSLIPVVLFLDEIHRFNKAQQDFLLPYVEDGTITLIGATTENPSFEVISPLLSRTRVFVLNALTEEELKKIITNASQKESISLSPELTRLIAQLSNGDARA